MTKAEWGQWRYLRKVRSLLPCKRGQKKEILAQIRGELEEYCSDHPEAGYDQLVERLGEPKSIAAAYVDSMDTVEILEGLRIRRKVMTTVAAVALAVLISWSIALTWAARDAHSVVRGDFQQTSTRELPPNTNIVDGEIIVQTGD